jgi:nucleoid-associated protein YgaU
MIRSENNIILKDENGKRYYNTTFYPLINPKDSDIYVITTVGDRLDILASQYYKDPTLWWVIASANNLRRDSVFITPGTQLRIPTDIPGFENEFNSINKNK